MVVLPPFVTRVRDAVSPASSNSSKSLRNFCSSAFILDPESESTTSHFDNFHLTEEGLVLGVSEVINAFGTRGGGIDFLVYPIPLTNSPGRYVLKIHFFIEWGLKMIQFKTKSGIFIKKKQISFNRVQNIQ